MSVTPKEIFSRNDVIEKMAFLNWRMESSDVLNLFNLGDGYFLSSQILCDSLILNNQHKAADIVIFPIFMNFNHAIELYLKGLILTLNELIGIERKIDKTHRISQLFNTVKSRVKDLDGQKKSNEFNLDNSNLSEYIQELVQKIDPTDRNDKMDFSRYPFTKKDENHFYVDTWSNVEVDLENLIKRITSIYNCLEQYRDFYYWERLQEDS